MEDIRRPESSPNTKPIDIQKLSRRRFLRVSAAAGATTLLAACGAETPQPSTPIPVQDTATTAPEATKSPTSQPTRQSTAEPTSAPAITAAPETKTTPGPAVSPDLIIDFNNRGPRIAEETFLVHANKYVPINENHILRVKEGGYPIILPIFQYCRYALGGQNLFTAEGVLDSQVLNQAIGLLEKQQIPYLFFIDGLPNFNNPQHWSSNDTWENYGLAMGQLATALKGKVLGYHLGSEIHENEDSAILLTHPELRRPQTSETDVQVKQREDQIYEHYYRYVRVCAAAIKAADPESLIWGPAFSWADMSENGRVAESARTVGDVIDGLTYDAFGPNPEAVLSEGLTTEQIQQRIQSLIEIPRDLYGTNLKTILTGPTFQTQTTRRLSAGVGGWNIGQATNTGYDKEIYHKPPHAVYIGESHIAAITASQVDPPDTNRRVLMGLFNLADNGIIGVMDEQNATPRITHHVQALGAQLIGSESVPITPASPIPYAYAAAIHKDGSRFVYLTNPTYNEGALPIQIVGGSVTKAEATIIDSADKLPYQEAVQIDGDQITVRLRPLSVTLVSL